MSAHEEDMTQLVDRLRERLENWAAESTRQAGEIGDLKRWLAEAEAERDALNACIRATCSAARIAREVGDHRQVVLLSDVERLLTVPELPPLSQFGGGE